MSTSQDIAKQILAGGHRIKTQTLSLLYIARADLPTERKLTIVVSVPKKYVPKATGRSYVKRRLRHLLREGLPKEILFHYDWMWIYKGQYSNFAAEIIEFKKLLYDRFDKTISH